MAKIKVEIEVPNDKYCDSEDTLCPVCMEGYWNKWYCAIFDKDLEIDSDSSYCVRCKECKQAEVKDGKEN